MSRRVAYYGPAIAVFAGVLALWELVVRAFGIQQFLLPPPSAITAAFVEHFDELMTVGGNTLFEAIGGLVIGGVAALVVAFATARWVTASRALLPFAIAANSVPLLLVDTPVTRPGSCPAARNTARAISAQLIGSPLDDRL